MAAKSVSHTVSLSIGSVALSLTDTQTADADPTDFVLGVQRVGTGAEYLGRAAKGDALGDVDISACKALLLLRNDNTSGGDLKVSFADSTVYELEIKPQQINLMSVVDLQDVKIVSSSGNCDFTYMAIQIDA